VPERQKVTIRLYDVLGRKVRTVVKGEKKGRHEKQLNVSGLASGMYFLRLEAVDGTQTQRLSILH